MDSYERIIQLIYDAIGEANQSLNSGRRPLERSPETLLIGGDGNLDSLQFLNLTVSVEEGVERVFKKTISVTDALLIGDEPELTVRGLARRIEKSLGAAAPPIMGVGA